MHATLTPRQAEVVRLFHDRADPRRTYGCASRAADAAGYAWPDKQGPRLMSFPAVKAEVERRQDATVEAMRAAREAELLRTWAAIYPKATLARYLAARGRRGRAERRRAGRAAEGRHDLQRRPPDVLVAIDQVNVDG